MWQGRQWEDQRSDAVRTEMPKHACRHADTNTHTLLVIQVIL